MSYLKIVLENIDTEHVCCAIADKKHQKGVDCKKAWIKDQFEYNHTFYKQNQNGKVFIEYVDSEGAWVPIVAPNYVYVHCLWVSGSFKGKGHSKELLEYCINDAKKRGKSGICAIAGSKKLPFLSDKAYLIHAGFTSSDKINNYELMTLSLDKNVNEPQFSQGARLSSIEQQGYVVYYSPQCPYTNNCISEMQEVAKERKLSIDIIKITSKHQAQNMPCVFNNFAVFKDGKFITHHLLNRGYFEKLLDGKMKV